MTKATFKSRVEALGGSLQAGSKFSNCNAWGFDGWFGEKTPGTIGGIPFVLESGSVGTRHQGTFPLLRVRVEGIVKPIAGAFFVDLLDGGLRTVTEVLVACENWSKKNLARR